METPQPAEAAKPEPPAPALDPPALNPLAESISHFEDDPFWDDMMDSIRRHRREMDAAWEAEE